MTDYWFVSDHSQLKFQMSLRSADIKPYENGRNVFPFLLLLEVFLGKEWHSENKNAVSENKNCSRLKKKDHVKEIAADLS